MGPGKSVQSYIRYYLIESSWKNLILQSNASYSRRSTGFCASVLQKDSRQNYALAYTGKKYFFNIAHNARSLLVNALRHFGMRMCTTVSARIFNSFPFSLWIGQRGDGREEKREDSPRGTRKSARDRRFPILFFPPRLNSVNW